MRELATMRNLFQSYFLFVHDYVVPSIFAGLLLFIAAVSAHDTVLVVFNHQVIADVEKNPVGRWLIHVYDGDIRLFILVKLLGTAVSCAVLIVFFRHWRRAAMAAATGIACFQFGLLLYLSLA